MDAAPLLSKKTLIYGEAGSGKTKLLAQMLAELTKFIDKSEFTVVDLAPPRIGDVGGPLSDYLPTENMRYLRPHKIYAPRLMACNPEDLRRYVAHNVEEARKCLQTYAATPTKLLAVNDATIFLHGGDVSELLAYAGMAQTFIATAYYGEKLSEDFGTGLSASEKRKVEELLKHVDVKVRLNSESNV
ncbi:MAG: hypothetical protein RMK31_03380 [Candidatus Caldarchaeum sp.]|nr:hypothetical protein [Candidatus Caldarchaeum sp.]MDW8359612.1 hypothetical protein [Candidatus Caldarchaeum sp.]